MRLNRDRLILLAASPLILAALMAHAAGKAAREFPAYLRDAWRWYGDCP